jgi:pheromone a factor receptor
MVIYTSYKHRRQFNQIMTSSHGLIRGRYLRLMILSSTGIIGVIPLGTYFMVYNAKTGIRPWKSWADTHSHYSEVHQVAGSIWKNTSNAALEIELFRWSLVVLAFNTFALFGIADEACQHYRLLYTWLARRIVPTAPPASIPLHFPDTTNSTIFGVDKV